MKAAKWGNSLAIRIPADVVEKLGISANEELELKVTGESSFEVTRDRRRQDAIEAIRKLAFPLPEGYRFNRDELYDRFDNSVLGKAMAHAELDSSKDDQAAQ
jgi:antitoxin MazE